MFAKQMIREVMNRRNLYYCLGSHLVLFGFIILQQIIRLYLDMKLTNIIGPKICIKQLEQS